MKSCTLLALLLVTSNAITLRQSSSDPNTYLPKGEDYTRGAGEGKPKKSEKVQLDDLSNGDKHPDPKRIYSPLYYSDNEFEEHHR